MYQRNGTEGRFSGTAAALGTVTGTRGRKIIFKVVTSGTETVSVSGQVGTDSSAAAVASTGKIIAHAILTGALHSTVDMDDGTFYIPLIYTDTLVFLGSSTSDTKTVTYTIFD